MKIKRIHLFIISFIVAFALYYLFTGTLKSTNIRSSIQNEPVSQIDSLEEYNGPLEGTKYKERLSDSYYIGDGYFLVGLDGASKVINKDGEVLTNDVVLYNTSIPEYKHFSASKTNDELLKYAIFNEKGERLTDYIYDEDAFFLTENLALVTKDGRTGVVDGNGKVLLEPVYESGYAIDFIDKAFLLSSEEGKHTIYDFECNELCTFEADYVRDIQSGMAYVVKDNVHSFYDYEGNIRIYNIGNYEWSSFYGDYAMKYSETQHYIVDKDGEIVVDFSADFDFDAEDISEIQNPSVNGTMIIAVDDRYALYDLNTKEFITDFEYDYINGFTEDSNITFAQKGDYYGLIDDKGNVVFDFIYEVVGDYSEEGIPVRKDGTWAVLDTKQNPISKYKYAVEDIHIVEDGYIKVSNEYYGFISLEDGNLIIGDLSDRKGKNYNYINEFSKNYIVVESNDYLYGLIDREGNEIIPCIYNDLRPLNDNLYWAENEDEIIIIDREQNVLNNFVLDSTFDRCSDGKHFYIQDPDGYTGMIDENGKTIIEPIFADIGNYGEIIPVVVEEENYNYRYVDTNGEYAFDRSFINAGSFINDRAVVATDDDEYYHIDKKGKPAYDERYDDVGPFTDSGVAWVHKAEKHISYLIDKDGNRVNSDFNAISIDNTPYPDRFTYTVFEGYTGLVNDKGEIILDAKYSSLEFSDLSREEDPTSLDYIIVEDEEGKMGVIDKDGNIIAEPKYDTIYRYSDDVALVYYNGEYNYLDTKGNLILEKGYQIASPFNSGVAIVYTVYGGDNNEAYIIDKEGNRIADLSKYTLLIPFANGTCVADDNEEAYLLDTKGNVIYPKEN